MQRTISILFVILLFVALDIQALPALAPAFARVTVSSARVYFQDTPAVPPDGWFARGSELRVIDDRGELWLVTGMGIQFDGRAARLTGWVDPSALSVLW